MLGAPRALFQDKVFVFVSSLLLMVSVATTRLFVSHYLLYRDEARSNVVRLLETKNLPYRSESQSTILAAVQGIFFHDASRLDCTRTAGHPETARLCRELDAKQLSFEALVAALDCGEDESCARNVARQAVALWPDGEADGKAVVECELVERIMDMGRRHHAPIVPCVSEPEDDATVQTAGTQKGPPQTGIRIDAHVGASWTHSCKDLRGMSGTAGAPRTAGNQQPPQHPSPSASGIRSRLSVHETLYGAAGCDQHGAALASSLVVPSRQNRCSADDNGTQESAVSLDGCYSERLMRSNDFSLLLDRLLSLKPIACRDCSAKDAESAPDLKSAASAYQEELVPLTVVQEYFLSPDSFVRYRDAKGGRSAYELFRSSRMWDSSPFIQVPIDTQAAFQKAFTTSAGKLLTVREAADNLCSTIPVRPYIDLGGYGFVETRCSCAVDGGGALVGVYCSDYTIPLSNPSDRARPKAGEAQAAIAAEHPGFLDYIPRLLEVAKPYIQSVFLEFREEGQNSLFEWQVISIDDDAGVTCTKEKIKVYPRGATPDALGSASTQAADDDITDGEAQGICSSLQKDRIRFFQEVQTISYSTGHHSLFFIPLSRLGFSRWASRLGILLRPNPAVPPWKSTVFMIMSWFLFAVMFLIRARLHSLEAATLRDDAILRGLPIGVIDCSPTGSPSTHPANLKWQYIEFANDRAEEVFGTALRVFGSRNDPAERRLLFDLIDEDLFEEVEDGKDGRPGTKLVETTLDQIDYKRRLGESSAYYARLKHAREPGEKLEHWIRFRGDAIFGDESFDEYAPRTFASVHVETNRRKVQRLNDMWWDRKNRAPQPDRGSEESASQDSESQTENHERPGDEPGGSPSS